MKFSPIEFDSNPEVSLRSPLDIAILDAVLEFHVHLSRQGINLSPFSDESIQELSRLSIKKKKHQLNAIQEVILLLKDTTPEPDQNLIILEKALKIHRLKAGKEIREKITENTIVEIYHEDGYQIFRSLSFYDFTGYSLLDLVTFEWFVLWQKPSAIIRVLKSLLAEVIEKKITYCPTNLKAFVNLETLKTGNTEPFNERAILLKPTYAGYLEKEYLGQPEYVLVLSEAEHLTSDPEQIRKIPLL